MATPSLAQIPGAGAGGGDAQPVPLPPPPKPKPLGQLDFGPLVLTPTIALLNVGIDNNVLNSNGQPESDFAATVSPQIHLVYKAGRLFVESTTAGDYIYYRKETSQGGFAPRTALNAEYRVSRRVTLLGNEQVESRKDRPSIEIDSRVRHDTVAFGAGVRVGIGPRLDVEIGARQTEVTYATDATFQGVSLQDTLNQTIRTATGTLAFRLTPYTTLKGLVTIDDQKFPRAQNRDGQSNLYGAALAFSPRALLSGEAMVGYRQFWSHSPVQPDFAGPAADGRLTLALGDVTGFLFSIRRDLMPSFALTTPYAVQLTYQAAMQQRLTRRFDLGLSYAAMTLDYKAFANVLVTPAPVGGDFTHNYGASFGFLSTRLGRYAIYVDHWERGWASDPTRNYVDTRIGFMITPTRWLTGSSSSRGTLVNTAGL